MLNYHTKEGKPCEVTFPNSIFTRNVRHISHPENRKRAFHSPAFHLEMSGLNIFMAQPEALGLEAVSA